MINHCVFYKTNIKYDGRVFAIVNTLALSYPNDRIYIIEYPISTNTLYQFPKNVIIKTPNLLFGVKRINNFIQIIKAIIFCIYSFVFLILKQPKTIQVHHEPIILGPLIYKFLFKKTYLVYDDKEMYLPRNKLSFNPLNWIELIIIKICDLLIITNEYRLRALNVITKKKIKKFIIIDNYIFCNDSNILNRDIQLAIQRQKYNSKNIIVHQGEINDDRGEEMITKIAKNLHHNWILAFIGINEDVYKKKYGKFDTIKTIYLGFIPYNQINSFYKYIDASLIIYKPNSYNNNYCAPNRLYSAVNNGVPIIVNSDNYTLSRFVIEHKNGHCINNIEDLHLFFQNYDYYLNNSRKLLGNFEYNGIVKILQEHYYQL